MLAFFEHKSQRETLLIVPGAKSSCKKEGEFNYGNSDDDAYEEGGDY